MKKLFIAVATLTLSLLNTTYAQLTLDRTRIIFDRAQSNSQSIVVSNSSKNEPYLAQSWIEDEHGNKIESPLVALPILQRINPGQEKQVKVSLAGQNNLPTDRESMLFFNVIGVPPKTGAENQVNIVIQSKVKLFYRPNGLKQYKDSGWLKELMISKTGNNITINNPTPYHAVIFGFGNQNAKGLIENDLVIPPFSEKTVQIKLGNSPSIYFIDDYGAAVTLYYRCQQTSCLLSQ